MSTVLGKHSVLVLDGEAHRIQRRLLMAPFRASHIDTFLQTMTAIAQSDIAKWPRNEPISLHTRMQNLTLDIILLLVPGLGEKSERLKALRTCLTAALTSMTQPHTQALIMLGPHRVKTWTSRRLLGQADRLPHAEIGERRRRNAAGIERRGDV